MPKHSVATAVLWPKLYDVETDEIRSANQLDLDKLVAVAQAYGAIRELLRKNTLLGNIKLAAELQSIHSALKARLSILSSPKAS